MIRRPPRFTVMYTLFPYSTHCRAHPIERRGHRIVAHAVVALDHDQGLAAAHAIALLHAHGPHGAGKTCLDLGMAVVIDRDAAHQAHRVADHRRSGGLPFNAGVLRSEEHTSELQSLLRLSYAVFCLY